MNIENLRNRVDALQKTENTLLVLIEKCELFRQTTESLCRSCRESCHLQSQGILDGG